MRLLPLMVRKRPRIDASEERSDALCAVPLIAASVSLRFGRYCFGRTFSRLGKTFQYTSRYCPWPAALYPQRMGRAVVDFSSDSATVELIS